MPSLPFGKKAEMSPVEKFLKPNDPQVVECNCSLEVLAIATRLCFVQQSFLVLSIRKYPHLSSQLLLT
jgi:hypothetical protein